MKRSGWLLLSVGVLLATWWVAGRLNAPQAHRVAHDPRCDLAEGACGLRLTDGQHVTLSLSPRPLKVMVPLQLEVTLAEPVTAVWVEFVGQNMVMGLNGVELVAVNQGLWQGQIVLPICTAAQMQWEARVFIQQGQTRIEAPFRFNTRP